MTCTCCGKDTVQTDIEIDHISDTGGTFTGIDDVRDYVAYLFLIDFKSIRAVCKDCHKSITYSQRAGVSVEEARLQRKVLEFLKQDKQIVIDYLTVKGYSRADTSNERKRRECVEKELRKEVLM
jgi:hypothetical protein